MLIHKMNLVDWAFNELKNGNKTIEVRLNDEKRQKLKIGELIVFNNIETGELLKTQIINKHLFKNFKEFFETFNSQQLGIKAEDNYLIMNKFYSQEQQEKYQALAIELKLVE